MAEEIKKSKNTIKNYVINLDRAVDRWQHMQEQFSNFGLEITRVPAIDGRNLSGKDIHHYRRGRYRLFMDSEIACFLSHRRCWQMIANGEEDYACVFEDDIYISSLLPDFLEKQAWPAHIKLLSIEQFEPNIEARREPVYEKDGYKIYESLAQNPGAAGYMVTRDFAKILLSHSEKFYHLVDAYLFHPKRYIAYHYHSYQITPALCVQSFKRAEKKDGLIVHSTSQEDKKRFSSRALKEKNGLSYLWYRLKATVKYTCLKRIRVPIAIDFIE